MTPAEAQRLIVDTTTAWVDHDESAVVWAGEYDGRWGIRMSQETRDFTTLWFDIGDLTVGLEAYLLPGPPHDVSEVYRQALARNWRSWPVWIALERSGDLYIVGRIPLARLDAEALDTAVGAVYGLVDVAFRPMVRAGFAKQVRHEASPTATGAREKTS